MKMKPQPAKMGLLRWLVETRKNPACVGDGEPTLTDIAELCYVFTVPFSELKEMSEHEINIAVEKFLEELEPEDFQSMQSHAESELRKFTERATTPKKPQATPDKKVGLLTRWLKWIFSRG